MTDMATSPEPRGLADWLLSRGRHWVTTTEAAELLGTPERHVAPSLARSRRSGCLFSPTKGLYVAIPPPPEFRPWGAVPAAHSVDPMMRRLGHDYYVCLLSAAEIHGFSHQRPQVFQVMTPARLRSRAFGRVRIEFITSVHTSDHPTDVVNTPTGTMCVPTLEATVLDLVSFPNASGLRSSPSTRTRSRRDPPSGNHRMGPHRAVADGGTDRTGPGAVAAHSRDRQRRLSR